MAPRLELPANLRSACLRGLLPWGEDLDVGGLLDLWVKAEARAECDRARAEAIVGLIDRANAEWEQAFAGRR